MITKDIWFPAYAQLVIGKEPISRPVLCRCKVVSETKLVHFNKLIKCGPAKCTRNGPVDLVFMTHWDEEIYRLKVAHHAVPGLVGIMRPFE